MMRETTAAAPARDWRQRQQHSGQCTSPVRRRRLLMERLSLSLRQRRDRASRKRPLPPVVRLAPAPSPRASLDAGRGITSGHRAILAVDDYEAWEEVSAVVPLLSYGEESGALLSSLLDLYGGIEPPAAFEGLGHRSGRGCISKNRKESDLSIAADELIRRRRQWRLSQLSRAIDHILQARDMMRRRQCDFPLRHPHDTSIEKEAVVAGKEISNLSPPLKKQRLEDKEDTASEEKVATEILPWNVVLRLAVRMASHVVEQLNPPHARRRECVLGVKPESTSAASKSEKRIRGDASKETLATMRPLLEVFDVALSELHLLARTQGQRPREDVAMATPEDAFPDVVGTVSTTPTRWWAIPNESSTRLRTPRSSCLPKDRMLNDWMGGRRRRSADDVGREVWGPSRHAFVKDIASIIDVLGTEAAGAAAGEWREKLDSVVMALDACIRADRDQLPCPEHANQLSLEISPSLRRYVAGRSECVSIASIARAHVERLGSRKKAHGETIKREKPLNEPHHSYGAVSVNLQSMMDEVGSGRCSRESRADEPKDPHRRQSEPASATSIARARVGHDGVRTTADGASLKRESPFVSKGQPTDVSDISVNFQLNMVGKGDNGQSMEDETDELEDAYRMAITFGSSDVEYRSMRETTERRLILLVRMVAATENRDDKSKGLDIDGARSYLESLLRALIRPVDPSKWPRSFTDSRGKEMPMMMRKARALLVSLLIGVQAPGWKDVNNVLEPSPLPSYLGYLSQGEERLAMSRSSYILMAVEAGHTNIPPPPIVTQVGLGLCVRKFLHGDAPERNILSRRSSGRTRIDIARNDNPLQYPCDEHVSLGSVPAPLPNTAELTSDLLDLILQFAASDHDKQEGTPISLRLAAPSVSESLDIVFRVVSDHLGWLSPYPIASRYRFVLREIIRTFRCSGEIDLPEKPSDGLESDGENFASWSRQASHLIGVAKMSHRGRMILYATQLMVLLCLRRRIHPSEACLSARRPNFYARLRIRQSSRFWNRMDQTSGDISNVMAGVLDLHFCAEFLLPLSYRCALLLETSSFLSHENKGSIAKCQGCRSVLSLVVILISVLDVLADNGLLRDCVHVGWAVQMLLLSIGHPAFSVGFCRGERPARTPSAPNVTGDCMWEYAARRLDGLYHDAWGKERRNFDGRRQSGVPGAPECVHYESDGNTVVLMPSFRVFTASLIKFASHLHLSADAVGVRSFCQFVVNKVFDRYAHALQSFPFLENGCEDNGHMRQNNEFSIISSWISALASNLQDMAGHRKTGSEERRKTLRGKAEEELMEENLTDLITPTLICLHLQITKRALCPEVQTFQCMDSGPSNSETSSGIVCSVFVDLYKREAEKFLKKPIPEKTRLWGVYRKCLEKIFILTPASTLLARPGHPSLTERSADALEGIWNQYAQYNLSHSVLIMVAAGLHVSTSATCPQELSSPHLKQSYDAFSSRAKTCIMNTFSSFTSREIKHSRKGSLADFTDLVCLVRRELSLHGRGGELGLLWWEEITACIFSSLQKSEEPKILDHGRSKKPVCTNIAKAAFTLQNNLSAISTMSFSE